MLAAFLLNLKEPLAKKLPSLETQKGAGLAVAADWAEQIV
jgi:hypothetical protein